MKRIISLLLSIVMLVGIVSCVDLSAYAAETKKDSQSTTTISIERTYEEHMLGATFAVSASYSSDTYAHNEDTISYEISGNNGGLIIDGGMSCIGTKENGIVSIPLKAAKVGKYTVTLKTIDGATDSITIEINEKLYDVYVASRLINRKEKIKNKNMLYHYIFDKPLDTTDFLSSWYINDDFKANKEYYYETVLLDILLKQSNDKDYIAYLNKTINNISSKCISYSLNYFEDSTESALKSKKFNSLTIEEKENLNQAYANATGINNVWDVVSSIKSGVDTVKDYFDKLSTYAALQNINEEYIEVLRYINILALQDSYGELSINATLLSNACENLIEVYSNKNVAVADCFKKTASTIIWDLTEDVTKEALKLMFGESASAIKITKDISLLVANSVFAADDMLKSTCLIKATDYIEKYLKKSLDSCGSEFNSDPERYAKDYISCHELLISCFNYGVSIHKYYSNLLYNDTVAAKAGSFLNSREKVIYEDTVECLEICDGLIATENKFIDSVISEYNSYKNGNKTQWVITLDTNAEFAFSSDIYVYDGDVIDLSSYKPQRNGYEFKGWYYDRNCTNSVEEGTIATTYLTLYAKWVQSCEYIIKANTAEISQYNFQYTATPVSPKKAKAKSTQEYYYDIDIPAYIDGYEVTSIGDTAFDNCLNYNVSSVRIPNTVTSISKNAFNNLPDSIAIIADEDSKAENIANDMNYSFNNQSEIGFTYIIDNGEVRICGFKSNYSPKEVIIPSKIFGYPVSIIGNGGYGMTGNWTEITKISLPITIKVLHPDSFRYCKSLEYIEIPESVEKIYSLAFYQCNSLCNVYFNGGIDNWCKINFSGPISNPVEYSHNLYINGQLLESATISDSTTKIGDYTFSGCESLTSITMPDCIKVIEDYAFSGCKNLTNVIIPNSVTRIGRHVFASCENLTSITIPDSVASIGDDAFAGCESLTSVYINNIENWCNIEFEDVDSNPLYNGFYGGAPYVGEADLYEKNRLITKITSSDNITNIGNYAFCGCRSLESIIIPNDVTSIGVCAFKYCNRLTNVIIGNSVTSIGSSAFENCNSLTNVTIPNSVTNIDNSAFAYCNSLENIIIPDSVTSIGSSAFENCKSLKNVTIGNNVTSIGNHAFEYCGSLIDVIIPESVISIGDSAFAWCHGGNIMYEGNIESWCKINFGYNWHEYSLSNLYLNDVLLETLILPDTVNTIYPYTFQQIGSIIVANIDNGILENIGDGAFSGCTGLTNVYIPNTVKNVGTYVFDDCTNLNYVTIPNSITSISQGLFNWCYRLNRIILPNSVKSIGTDAFYNLPSSADILYSGSKDDWNSIIVESGNKSLNNVKVHYSVDEKHDYALIEHLDATCYEDGYNKYSCSCEYEKTVLIPSGHQNQLINTINPTCTSGGYTIYKCSRCGSEYNTDYVDSLGHTGDAIETIASSCVNQGYTKYHCTRCNEDYTDDYVDALGHNFVESICQNCGKEESDCIESSHPYDDDYDNTWTINKPNAKRIAITFSNCTETESCDYIYVYDKEDNEIGRYSGTKLASKRIVVKGDTVKIRLVTDGSVTYYGFALSNVQTYYEDCDHIEKETEIRNEKISTCSSKGYTGDTYCVECDEIILKGKELPIDADNHDMQEKVVKPTCTEQGYTEYYCWDCDYSYKTDYTPATGAHTYVNGFCKDCKTKDSDYTLPVITIGKSQPIEVKNYGDYYYLSFTPKSNGTCTFYSTGDYDTYGYLYDENMNELESNDDGGEGYNFSITYDLQVGETYILACGMLDSDETGIFDVTLEFNENLQLLTGDVNGDGKIDIRDATTIQKHIAQLVFLDEEQIKVADTNGDGEVNITDATQIQKSIAQLIPSLG